MIKVVGVFDLCVGRMRVFKVLIVFWCLDSRIVVDGGMKIIRGGGRDETL
jgi:hypothetical protein